jgi:hypothetical protein
MGSTKAGNRSHQPRQDAAGGSELRASSAASMEVTLPKAENRCLIADIKVDGEQDSRQSSGHVGPPEFWRIQLRSVERESLPGQFQVVFDHDPR